MTMERRESAKVAKKLCLDHQHNLYLLTWCRITRRHKAPKLLIPLASTKVNNNIGLNQWIIVDITLLKLHAIILNTPIKTVHSRNS